MDSGGGGGGRGGGLLGDIQKGFALKKVDSTPKPAPPPSADDGGGGSLADTLKKAMIAHRKDIEGHDAQGAEDDEWD